MLKNDLHVHSIGSGHAYSTISEVFRFASKNKMGLIAIADHGPNMEGAPHLGYFENMLRLPKTIDGVTFLKSCEANILNENGEIDIPLDLQNKLDFVMAGLHARTDYTGRDTEKNTQAVINAVKNNKIKIITHPYRPGFPIDIPKVVEACSENKVALELNIESLKVNRDNSEFISEIKKLLNEVVKSKGNLVISSDAHYELEIGDDSIIKELNIEIPEGILLESKEQIMEFLGV